MTEVSLSGLPYLPQTVCKEQRGKRERERHGETESKGEREGETATGQKAIVQETVACCNLQALSNSLGVDPSYGNYP